MAAVFIVGCGPGPSRLDTKDLTAVGRVAGPPSTTVRVAMTAEGMVEIVAPGETRTIEPRGRFALSVEGGAALEVGPLAIDRIQLAARRIDVHGALQAMQVKLTSEELLYLDTTALIAADDVELVARVISNVGTVSADGKQGGSIELRAENVMNQGTLAARGSESDGGRVSIVYDRNFAESARGNIDVSGARHGGTIRVAGGGDSHLFTSGTHSARGQTGGEIGLFAGDVKLVVAALDASGEKGGGQIDVGQKSRSAGSIAATHEILVRPGTTLRADAEASGSGGRILLASVERTLFSGRATARGGARAGNGGFVEVSSAGELGLHGDIEAEAKAGRAGNVVIDPKNITISDGAATKLLGFELIDPTPARGDLFGHGAVALSTGNVLVPDSIDDSAARRAGAVHLFSGRTGALLATLTGGRANDNYDTTALPLANGNYVVLSPSFDYGANPDAGAVTWGSGVTGIAGVVSTTNSLVGASAGDQVGVRVTALTNGNYVVSSEWRDGSGAAVGAATWCDGATGKIGAVTAANSLIGASQVTPLPNGNYVVSNPSWSNGAAAAVGAVTWCNGNTGRSGTISAANSLVGITANDQVGSGLVTALKNGNYVVNSPKWDNGSIVDDGAVTWGNGATGSAGQVTVANSLVGNTNAQILALTNGHYVVSNSYWDNGSVVDVGAVTWCNGTTGRTGRVSAANSLVGTTANGWAAAHTALSNGHYVVQTLTFNNGSATRAGAVTWCNGTTATTGVVSAANSLVGTTADDYIGYYITPLTNGNYVVSSPYWDNGAVKDAGAVTWCNGASSCTGVVSVANSLYGSTADDRIGNNLAAALANGNYVVQSTVWDNGTLRNAGAATWGNGATGITGAISAANSFVGSVAEEFVGLDVRALTNSNYVISNEHYPLGAGDLTNGNLGTVTWCSGGAGCRGTATTANSLVGARPGSVIGAGPALANGDYIVETRRWATVVGAAVARVDGTKSTAGVLSESNSLVERRASVREVVGSEGPLPGTFLGAFLDSDHGHVYVGVTSFEVIQPGYAFAPDQSLTIPSVTVTSLLERGLDLELEASNDITVAAPIVVNNPSANGGGFTLAAGRSLSLGANIVTDNGNLTLIANDVLANGVVDAQRDPGPGGIGWSDGVQIDAGTGVVRLEVRNGAGKTNSQSGKLELGQLSAGNVFSRAEGSALEIKGACMATGTGDAITLVSDVFFEASNAAESSLRTPSGRYLIYAPSPATAMTGAIALSFQEYGKSYPALPDPANAGPGILYASLQPDTDGGAGDAGERDGGEGDSGGVAPDAAGADSMAMDAPAGDAARADASNRDTPPNREDDGACTCSTVRASSHRGTAAFVCIALLSIARLRRIRRVPRLVAGSFPLS